ncbi:MAG TPA: hypothetical protein VFW28_08760 [Micropepsaceae bacterium]|nr:hypothetical protein [Micropepsaceae bacterium]
MRFVASHRMDVIAAVAALCVASAIPVCAQTVVSNPDFQSGNAGWVVMNRDGLAPPTSGYGPTRADPAHPYIPNSTFRIADVTSPNLKPWAAEAMRKSNDEVLAGKFPFTARSSCMPAGVPGFSLFVVEPVFFMQSPKEVLMVYSGDQQVRRVWMDVPHTANPKPSWYGESVGHYEGDTLVVDTIGLNTRTFLDNYRTPHSEKLHVVERYRLTNDGRVLENLIRVEDPDTFNQPWSATQRYRKVQDGPMDEQVCAENTRDVGLFGNNIPQAAQPDF